MIIRSRSSRRCPSTAREERQRSSRARSLSLLTIGAALVATAIFALGASAAVSPTVRISLVHFMRGCHVWSIGNHQAANATIKVKPGTRIELRISCPMSFELSQVAGPKIPLADPVLAPGTTRVLVFKTRGVYRFTATNLQSSSDAGLQTLGDDNRPMLTVRVG